MKIIYTKNGCDEELTDHNTNTNETNINKNNIKSLFSKELTDFEIENSFAVFDWKKLKFDNLIDNFFIAFFLTLFISIAIEPYIIQDSVLYLLSYLLLSALNIVCNWYMDKIAIKEYNESKLRKTSEIQPDKDGNRFVVFFSATTTESHKIVPLSELNYNSFKRFYYEDNENDHIIEIDQLQFGIEDGREIIEALKEQATSIFVEDIKIENTLIINL